MRMYQVVLTPDRDDGGYTVTVPSLPGCISEGNTVEEALTNAKEAISVYLDYLNDKGESIEDIQTSIVATIGVD